MMNELNCLHDNHMCIRCKQTITGLDNYLTHRKRNDCQPMSANTFFNCLQLQHINPTLHKSIHNGVSVEYEHYNNNTSDDEYDDEEDDDIYRPPRHFTGAKWKPGCRPIIHNISDNSDYSSDNCDDFATNTSRRTKISSERVLNEAKDDSHLNDTHNFDSLSNNISKSSNDTLIDKIAENNTISEQISLNSSRKQLINLNNNDHIKCKVCSFTSNSLFNILKHCLDSNSHLNYTSLELRNTLSLYLIEIELILTQKMLFACEICSFYTNESNNFIWHITTKEHAVKVIADHISVYKCVHCDHISDNIEKLIEHLKSKQNIHINSRSPLINCTVLPKPELNDLIKKNSNTLKCEYCEKKFKFKTHVKLHTLREHIRKVAFPRLIKTITCGNSGKYCCNDCGFKSDCEATHLLHSINHCLPVGSSNESVNRNNDKYKCPRCDQIYICRELKKHIYTHIEIKPFNCGKCGKSFAKKNSLNSHQKSHFGVKDKLCAVCGASFVLNKFLKRHMKTHDTNRERNLKCDLCGAKFFSNSILQLHVKRHLPKNQRQFKCSQNGCRFAFVQKSELVEHQRVHSDPSDKPFLCDRCPYKTKSVFTFRKHYRKHTGYKPFKCEFCDYTTGLSSNLSRHKRTHTGDKPYKCPYCSYACNTQENVRKHILKTKKHNGLYVYPCIHCSFGTNIFAQYIKHVQEHHSSLYTEKQIDNLGSHLFVKNRNDEN